MTFTSGMISYVENLKKLVDGEVDKLEDDVGTVINKIASETGRAFDTVFDDIKTVLRDTGEYVESDFKAMETLLDRVVKKMESVAESEYHGLRDRVDDVVNDVEDVTRKAVTEIEDATEYVRTKAYDEFDEAITAARRTFRTAEDDFKGAIESLGESLIDKVKSGVKTVVSSAQHDLDKINSLRVQIDDEIKAKVKDIENDLISLKNEAREELDRITSFLRREVDKLETRVKRMADDIGSLAGVVGFVSVVGALGISAVLYAMSRTSSCTPAVRPNADAYDMTK